MSDSLHDSIGGLLKKGRKSISKISVDELSFVFGDYKGRKYSPVNPSATVLGFKSKATDNADERLQQIAATHGAIASHLAATTKLMADFAEQIKGLNKANDGSGGTEGGDTSGEGDDDEPRKSPRSDEGLRI